MRAIRNAAILLVFLMAGGCAQDSVTLSPAPVASGSGTIEFASAGGLMGQGTPAKISGVLTFPAGDGPYPVIVLAHGCNGERNSERAWGPTLRSWGYATFIIDSFRPRGIEEVCTNARTMVPLQRVPDAYGALRMLATHASIDPRRIALMGFSHGGMLTMLASTAWAKETFVPAGQPAFRAFFPFYPNCNAEFPERNRVSAPVRIHTGELDDWTPAKPCAELAAALKASGQDVAINIYPGAHHAFDQARGYIHLPNVGNGSACFPRLASILGLIPGGAARGGFPACVKRGATISGNPQATADARGNLRAQFDELIK